MSSNTLISRPKGSICYCSLYNITPDREKKNLFQACINGDFYVQSLLKALEKNIFLFSIILRWM